MIVLQGVKKRYPGSGAPAVDGIDLEVPDGSVVGIVGPNGAGKSTLLRLVAGLTRPSGGSIEVDGADIVGEKVRASRAIGWVPETPRFDPEERPRRLLERLARLDGAAAGASRERISALLHEVGLARDTDRPVRTLSQGQQKRLAIATAWLHEPKHLLYDEVTNGLDAGAQALWRRSVRAGRTSGKTVLFASHRWEEVEALAEWIAVLEEGRLTAFRARDDPRWADSVRVVATVERPEAAGLAVLSALGTFEDRGTTLVLEVSDRSAHEVAEELTRRGIRIRELRTEVGASPRRDSHGTQGA